MAVTLSDYVDITHDAALRQWRSIVDRVPVPNGQHQVDFLPVETLMCLAAMFAVKWQVYGSGSAHRAPTPVPELARLFVRPPTSVIAKMANLDGIRPHGARFDRAVSIELREDVARLAEIYRTVLGAARAAGIPALALPDFLALEHGGALFLLGQDELERFGTRTALEREMELLLTRDDNLSERDTERIVVGSARVGQHLFARSVLDNCAHECVFCGFVVPEVRPSGLLRASHIKPWRDSTHRERLDVANGVAACPTHDAAFDAGLLTIEQDLSITLSAKLRSARATSSAVEHFFGSPPLRGRVGLPPRATLIDAAYLDWHRGQVFVA